MFSHYPSIRAICCATAALAPLLAAAEAEPAQKPQETIDTVTIIGHRNEVADVPGSAHVIDAEALALFNDTDILRVLRTVPGVYLQEEEGFGLRPNIGIRGSGLDRSARIALLEDGILIAPAPYSAASAYYFPTQRRMSGLEVLKGPASIAVGPRTTGGALNMISTPVPDALGASLDARVGDYNTVDAHLNAGDRGERFGWLAETVQSQSDGFKEIAGPVGGDSGYRIEDYLLKLELNNDPQANVLHGLRYKGGYTSQHSDETYLGLTAADFAADPVMRYAASANDAFDSQHRQHQLTYVVDPRGRWRGSLTVFRNEFRRNWYKVQSVDGTGIADVLADPATYASAYGYLTGTSSPDDAIQIRANNRRYYSQGLQGQLEWELGLGDADIALTAGFGLHEDEEDRFQHQDGYRMEDGMLVLTTAAAGGSQSNRVADAEVQSLFVAAEIRAGRWILTPGLRHESIDLRRLDYATADPGRLSGPTRIRRNSASVFIPGAGALYRVNDRLRLLAGLHKGYSPPSPGSTAGEESSVNFEAGARYDSGALSMEAIYFVNDYDNLVGTVTNSTGGGGEIGDQFDGGEAVVSGLELTAAYSTSAGSLAVPLSLSYTWTQKAEFENAFDSDFDPWGEVLIGDELPYIPEQQLRATAGLEGSRWRANLSAAWVGRMRSVAGQGAYLAAETIESHLVWDALASWSFTPQFSAYLKVDNLLDETYVASRRPAGLRPGLPRSAYLGVTYRLGR